MKKKIKCPECFKEIEITESRAVNNQILENHVYVYHTQRQFKERERIKDLLREMIPC